MRVVKLLHFLDILLYHLREMKSEKKIELNLKKDTKIEKKGIFQDIHDIIF